MLKFFRSISFQKSGGKDDVGERMVEYVPDPSLYELYTVIGKLFKANQ